MLLDDEDWDWDVSTPKRAAPPEFVRLQAASSGTRGSGTGRGGRPARVDKYKDRVEEEEGKRVSVEREALMETRINADFQGKEVKTQLAKGEIIKSDSQSAWRSKIEKEIGVELLEKNVSLLNEVENLVETRSESMHLVFGKLKNECQKFYRQDTSRNKVEILNSVVFLVLNREIVRLNLKVSNLEEKLTRSVSQTENASLNPQIRELEDALDKKNVSLSRENKNPVIDPNNQRPYPEESSKQHIHHESNLSKDFPRAYIPKIERETPNYTLSAPTKWNTDGKSQIDVNILPMLKNRAPLDLDFLRKFEIMRHFIPFTTLKPNGELLDQLRDCHLKSISPRIQDFFEITLPSGSARLWHYVDHVSEQPFNDVIYKVIIRISSNDDAESPFEIELLPPSLDSICRARCLFKSDRFLRVEYDKEMLKLPSKKLPRAINICGRTYEFLVNRDSYCYFFATQSSAKEAHSFPKISTLEVVDKLVSIKANLDLTINKFSSRLALGFSNILTAIPVEKCILIEDVVCNGNIMTDGCAPIGSALMQQIKIALALPQHSKVSAVQGRFGSAKGVWYLDPYVDPDTIYIRKSQLKYSSKTPKCLEIIGFSKASGSAKLNRQLVSLLETLGVPPSILVDMQTEMVERIRKRLFGFDPFVVANYAEKLMKANDNPNDDNSVFKQLMTLILSGFDKSNFYVKSLLNAVFGRLVSGMKERAKIEIEDSRMVLIVADPSGELKPGECFLQFANSPDDEEDDFSRIMQGPVAVARNPCHLASDLRLLQCVDIPALRHFREVLVLSVHGEIPEAEYLSGGDYDGDRVFVTWDARITQFVENKPIPKMDSIDSLFEEDKTQVREIVESGNFSLLVNYLFDSYVASKSLLRLFSHFHMKLSDMHSLHHEQCIELAYVCRKLLDSGKTGVKLKDDYVRKWSELLMDAPVPHWYPRGNSTANTRQSTSAIAHMYDSLEKWIKMDLDFKNVTYAYDDDLMEIYKAIPVRESRVMEIKMQRLFDEYNAELSMMTTLDPGNDGDNIGKRFRRKLFSGARSREDMEQIAVIAYKITADRSLEISKPMDFCWKVCGDVLESIKAFGVERKNQSYDIDRPVPLVIPRSYLRRLAIDQRTLIFD